MKKIIKTVAAPAPIGPYNQAILINGMLFISGQIAINPADGTLLMDDVVSESVQVMKNLEAILHDAGFEFNDVVKTSIFLKNMGDFAKVNEVYGTFFTDQYPARETVEVSVLPKGANVEISMIAVKD